MKILDRDLERLTQSKLLRRVFKEKKWWLRWFVKYRTTNFDRKNFVVTSREPLVIKYGAITVLDNSDYDKIISQHLTEDQIITWLSGYLKHNS